MSAWGAGTNSSASWLRALAELFPGTALLLGAILVCAPASAPAGEESTGDSLAEEVTASSTEGAALETTPEPSGLEESFLALSAVELPLADAESSDSALPNDASDWLPARTVGMCGDHAQSIEAPPPIYPGSGAALRGCSSGGAEVEKLDSLPPAERLALDSAPAFRTAIVAEPLRIAKAARSTIDFPPFERFVTEEHRAREPRPPRG